VRINHLLRRAGFGVSREEHDRYQSMGLNRVIDELVHYGVLDLIDDDSQQIEVPSVATLDLTGQLMAAGASPEVVQAAWALMQARIADLADEVWHPPGKLVIEEGKAPIAFYVILDGQARVIRGPRKKLLRRLGPGDYFGELSLIDNHPRSASIVADTTLDTIRLKRSAFRSMLRGEPEVALRIMEGMTALIRDLQHDAAE